MNIGSQAFLMSRRENQYTLNRSVLQYRTAHRAPGVINLKLPHMQMPYRQSSFLKDFTMKTTTKVTKNILPGHHKLKICLTK